MLTAGSKFALAATVALLAIVESLVALTAPLRVASDADWRAAAEEVRKDFRSTDLIAFAPYWADQTGRMHFGDKITVEMAGRADADRYSRIWEVSLRGERARETEGLKPVRETRHGKVRVALYEKGAAEIATDFTSRLGDARVSVADLRSQSDCLRDVSSGRPSGTGSPSAQGSPGFRCPGTLVEKRTLEIDYKPRRGILVPIESGKTTRIEFDGIELGKTIIGYTGLHDYYARKNADGPVDVRVFVDGIERLSVRAKNEDGWKRFLIDTSGYAGPGHIVRFEISSPNPAWRNLGLHVEARK